MTDLNAYAYCERSMSKILLLFETIPIFDSLMEPTYNVHPKPAQGGARPYALALSEAL